jgi:hypothetical protein
MRVAAWVPTGDKGSQEPPDAVSDSDRMQVPDLYFYKYPTEQRQMRQETLMVVSLKLRIRAKQAGVLHKQ